MQKQINLELLLRDLYESISELSVVLDAEYEALNAQDVELLQKAAMAKDGLSEKVDELEANRRALLDALGLDNDLTGMKLLIQDCSSQKEDELFKIWNMVSELAQECTTKNKLNGIIIEAKRRQTDAALSILQGNNPDHNELYDAEGTTVSNKSNSTIAKA
ncbi:MAG: flagellar protein FlgN [Gammaproteobacteria bacterium]|nr:flagellar protein FlgN [Gammaproteobacteria bacterium]